ncbi:MAG: hypothetical protein V2B18_15885 [Pseudomonadota bacterium]
MYRRTFLILPSPGPDEPPAEPHLPPPLFPPPWVVRPYGDARGHFRRSKGPVKNPPRQDPLIVDLDGDGIETTNLDTGAHFDHDGNGFAELTGWVGSDDGLLVMDRNGDGIINDGRELFGDHTVLATGTPASNGFEALADLDGNADGTIDKNDPAYAQLMVWQDADGDGYTSAGELHTLDDLGIKAIDIDSTITSATDAQGNTQTRTGSFEKADGSVGEIAEYNLRSDHAYSIADASLDVPDAIASLPYLWGCGVVYDLHQSMVKDTGGQLQSLVEQFRDAADPTRRGVLMERILFKWTGTENIDPTSKGSEVDARKPATLEKLFGESFVGWYGPNPIHEAAVLINASYSEIFELMYTQLMIQTHFKDLLQRVTCAWDDERQVVKVDLNTVAGVLIDLQAGLADDPAQGRQIIGEFARILRGAGIGTTTPGYLSFRETFIQLDPTLDWVIDSGGLPVIDQPVYQFPDFPPNEWVMGICNSAWYGIGTDNAEALRVGVTVLAILDGRGGK